MIDVLCTINKQLDHMLGSGLDKPFLRDLGTINVIGENSVLKQLSSGISFGIDERNGTLFIQIIHGSRGAKSVCFKVVLPDGFIIEANHAWDMRSDAKTDTQSGALTIGRLELNVNGAWIHAVKITVRTSIEDQFGYKRDRLSITLPYTIRYSS